jgi:hypothetical protein
MTGAAPVPVPPPMPQVTKTMSAPFSTALSSSTDSSPAFLPIPGSPPDPSPLVSLSPMRRRWGALESIRDCASVLIATNSTPWMPRSIMRLTAFEPPPPIPKTLIWAGLSLKDVGCPRGFI